MVTAAVARHMSSVEDYRERLAALQGSWDTLSLLSHLSGDATEMGGTRQAFEALTGELVRNLTAETHRKTLLALKAKSQIAIDVLVRNLYERTADIGFLSTDDDIRRYLRQRRPANDAGANDSAAGLCGQLQDRLRHRFREYVAKYSVYQDVILLAPDGEVLLRLDTAARVTHSRDALIAEALATRAAYVETFREVDLLPGQPRSLIYSFRIGEAGKALGVLCLCFRFDDEVAGIFSGLRDADDWNVFAFLDGRGHVIASSDPWQLPLGAPMTLACEAGGRVVRFGGREYLAISRQTQGYQGYLGPGWYGHAMVPVEHAYDRDRVNALNAGASIPAQILADLRESGAIFSPDLRNIPRQAEQIQRELNRAVWNGNIRLALRADASISFAKVLLWEIGNAGRRTQATFEQSISDLQQTVVSAILQDTQLLATLAADILDRNLYERANDCRWWALNATLFEHLTNNTYGRETITAILRHINSLYTVYHDIVLFNTNRQVVAVANSAHDRCIGTTLAEAWAGQTLALRNSQDFVVAEFAPSPFYGDQPTLVFGAAVRDSSGRIAGGVGVVFDARPQLEAMLRDSLPRTESGEIASGCISVFMDAKLRVIAATSAYRYGDCLPLPREWFAQGAQQTARVAEVNGTYYAVGVRQTGGYREYNETSIWCVVMVPLGTVPEHRAVKSRPETHALQRHTGASEQHAKEQRIDIATFHSNHQWLGLLREQVVEAIDGSRRRPIPGSPPWHAGLLMYRDAPIPVIDIARLMGSTAGTQGRDVIVVRPTADTPMVGLMIDELAGIPEVPVSRILSMADFAQRGGAVIADRAVRPDQPEDPVLLIINLEQLLLHTSVTQPAVGGQSVHKASPA